MTVSYKVLGQVNPTATTNTNAYTVPNGYQAVVSTLNVCNMGTVDGNIRIAVRPSGQTLEAKHYIVYNTPIAANDSISLTIGITLSGTDVITVYADTADMSFNIFGSEIV